MMPDRQTNFVYFSSLLTALYADEWRKIESILKYLRIDFGFLNGTKDIWCRDYMPVQITETEFVQFQYNSSYLKGARYKKDRTIPGEIVEWQDFNPISTNITLDGGNVVRWNDRAIISDRVFDDNKGWGKKELIREIELLLKAEVLIVPADPDDMTGHADGMVRFCDANTILVNSLKEEDPDWVIRIRRTFRGKGFKFINIPFFQDPFPEKEASAVGIYLNFLEIANLILLPVFADQELQTVDGISVSDLDKKVIRQFEDLYPNHMVRPIEINRIGRKGGLMNCISWNIKQFNPQPDIHLIPIYHEFDDVLLIHELDFTEGQMLEDGLCINISLRTHQRTPIIRGQNFLRFGNYVPILLEERQEWTRRIEESISPNIIREIERLLEFPTSDLMRSLSFVPPRLR
ncbi:MAG: hypothetical protein D4R64_05560 [Porphyromonadaceae bacterium]|nr:MAG: hypothetical protein D4R64_05560 [Porphyromonadaceae bacterium]